MSLLLLYNNQPPTDQAVGEARVAVESADWTGIEERLAADPAAMVRIQQALSEIDAALDGAGLSNLEMQKAKALTGALTALINSPEPAWKHVADLLITFWNSPAITASINAATIIPLIGTVLYFLLNAAS